MMHLINTYDMKAIVRQKMSLLNYIKPILFSYFTLFLILRLIFLRFLSSCFDSGSLVGNGYPSEIRVLLSSSVKMTVPLDEV